MVANTGEPTRQSRAEPFTLSTSDVTLHHARWAGRVEWRPQDALSSDQRPILVDLDVGKRPQRQRRRPRPSLAKVDWTKYDRCIEEGLRALQPWADATPLKSANEDLAKVILEAAEAAIPRGARKVPKLRSGGETGCTPSLGPTSARGPPGLRQTVWPEG